MICDKLEIIVSQDCPNVLLVDLRQYTTFADAATAGFKIQNGDVVLTKGADHTDLYCYAGSGGIEEHAAGLLQMADHDRSVGQVDGVATRRCISHR